MDNSNDDPTVVPGQIKIGRNNLSDINEINDLTSSVIYELSQPLVHNVIRYEVVTIRRPKLKHQKKLAMLKDGEQVSKLIEYTTDLATHLIDELDLADVVAINKVILKMLGKSQEI